MKWYQDYNFIFTQFDRGAGLMDETQFYFRSDPLSEDHMIGYLPQYDKPYWVGGCDVPDGCEFNTAKEMFEASIFDGRSLKERRDDVVIVNIGGISVYDVKKSWFE